jgi:hypothetical protein
MSVVTWHFASPRRIEPGGLHVSFNGGDDAVCEVEAVREEAFGVAAGVAVHHALISCTAVFDSFGDLWRLPVYVGDDVARLVSELVRHSVDDGGVVRVGFCGDFSGENYRLALDHAFASDTAVYVFVEASVEDSVADLVGVLVGVVF